MGLTGFKHIDGSTHNVVQGNTVVTDGDTKARDGINVTAEPDDFHDVMRIIVTGAATASYKFNGANSVTSPNIGG
jgi:hypothetical protein